MHVVGYNWLIAAALIPVALFSAVPLALLPDNVKIISIFACAAYIAAEATAYCAERNWSGISVLVFWRLAGPLAIAHVLLCVFLTRRDALGCMLFSAILLGLRESLFQLCYATFAVGRGEWRERLLTAFLGGFAYSWVLTLLCGGGYILVNTVLYNAQNLSHVSTELLYVMVLPLSRAMLRLLLMQLAGSVAPSLGFLGRVGNGIVKPQLDALVLYSDAMFALILLLEVPFAFASLMPPRSATFCWALAANSVLDIVFVYVIDLQQSRHLQRLATVGQGLEGGAASPDAALPMYCMERPRCFVATLTSGQLLSLPGEATRLNRQQPDPSVLTNRAAHTSSYRNRCEECINYYCCIWRSDKESGVMSPRVSQLLQEYDSTVIKLGAAMSGSHDNVNITTVVYIQQERKVTITTHLVGNTLALGLAVLCVPLLGLHTMSLGELIFRIIALVTVRAAVDLIACWVLGGVNPEAANDGHTVLWHRQPELASLHTWLYRSLAGICPLLIVIAGS